MKFPYKVAVYPVRKCGRLVSAALPLDLHSAHGFDTRTFCSRRCADSVSRSERRPSTGPLVTCDTPSGTLNDGRSLFLKSVYLTLPLSCKTSSEERAFGASARASLPKWVPYAAELLPADQRDAFDQQLFDHALRTEALAVWTCPYHCGFLNGVTQPNATPGFPHVECAGCKDHFCANCKVRWHSTQSCQEYRVAHPEAQDNDEAEQLLEMARMGAKRCPRCQFIIVKDGGCDHIFCQQCHFEFDWMQAVDVTAPLPTFGHPTSTLPDWDKSKQVQDKASIRDSTSVDGASVQTKKDIIFYDQGLQVWWPEICELEALAGQAEGRRFIREPSQDRGNLWAFIMVDHEHVGGTDFAEALGGHYPQYYTPGEQMLGLDPLGRMVVAGSGDPNDPYSHFGSQRTLYHPADALLTYGGGPAGRGQVNVEQYGFHGGWGGEGEEPDTWG
ncbi:hypothetical protein OPT61_g9739 [Boeremia exigua]|uniref:Uncharacterized protein n=1 Tax=Boeremia exigua TaxID=749465 RepID=A0ACC2HTM7_9PLEO|nr:hypothetical protein OPT61_g9739 [Boeremia exigua]